MIQSVALALLLAGGAQAQPAQPAALRVVVIEGEDAVNIIQQKTAVRPLVEVRDRNNLPVAGAVVTFSIPGGASTFGGAATLTVATNAAGQAAVTGLTPSVAGAFQIQVSAAFQGQIATATIAQTNVLTAAQAVAAGAASGSGSASSAGGAGSGAGGGAGGASGAAAGGAGGLSTTTLVVAGAAVAAGGAVAASQIAGKEDGGGEFTGTFSGTIAGTIQPANFAGCTYTRSVSASARLKFDEFSDSTVRGKFDYSGTDTVVSTTCNVTPSVPPFLGEVEVTGSPSRFTGRNAFPTSAGIGVDGGSITGEAIYTFEGSISGNTATGTFKYEQKGTSVGGTSGGNQSLSTGTFTITLQKQ